MTDTDKLDLLLAYQRLQFLSGRVPHGDLTDEEFAELQSLRGALKLCNSGQYGQINKQADDPVTIQIVNPDAVDAHLTMQVDAASVANIVMWYGAFYDLVTVNGAAVALDHNGEIVIK